MDDQKPVELVPVAPPPPEHRRERDARFAEAGQRQTRYTLPKSLDSPTVVGYRTRISLSPEEGARALGLLSLERPTAFGPSGVVTEQELFEECSLGILTARQSTNYRGHRQVTLGPDKSREAAAALATLPGLEAPVLEGASHTHVVLSRPYRTLFTMLLTLAGHKPLLSLLSVPLRIARKRLVGAVDIPTIGYLQDLHIGILADTMDRAAVLASAGRRRAQVFMAPFAGRWAREGRAGIARLEALAGLGFKERIAGWRVAVVAQVGSAAAGEEVELGEELCRRLGANLVAFRSERIQPGVNFEDKAPEAYKIRQPMDVEEELTVQCGRAGYNAFTTWVDVPRERAKELVVLERIDVLTPGGKERLRDVRRNLEEVTDRLVSDFPKWVDLPSGRLFSRNAAQGRKAFALSGQRIYLAGLCRDEIEAAGLDWRAAIQAFGAFCSRSALVAEITGVVDIPEGCDLLAGICVMAGPVNQNDIGKTYYGAEDLLQKGHPERDPCSLLVWTLKAKTVADPIGNEEQLMNTRRKGLLVELRPGPHDVIQVEQGGQLRPLRQRSGRVNGERAFGDVGNFVTDHEGRSIPGNRGSRWPEAWAAETLWGAP